MGPSRLRIIVRICAVRFRVRITLPLRLGPGLIACVSACTHAPVGVKVCANVRVFTEVFLSMHVSVCVRVRVLVTVGNIATIDVRLKLGSRLFIDLF